MYQPFLYFILAGGKSKTRTRSASEADRLSVSNNKRQDLL